MMKIKRQQRIQFSLQLSHLLSTGIVLNQSLKIIEDTPREPALQSISYALRRDIEQGQTLHQALAKHPQSFSTFYLGLINAAEHSGQIEPILQRLAKYDQFLFELSQNIRSALSYPFILIITAITVTFLMLILVIPKFEALFNNLDAELPIYTQWVIHVSDYLQNNIFLILLVLAIFIIMTVMAYQKHSYCRYGLQRLIYQMPLIGKLLQLMTDTQLQSTLATLLEAGIPIIDSLKLCAYSTHYLPYRYALDDIQRNLKKGVSFNQSCRQYRLLDLQAQKQIDIGERTGKLDQILALNAQLSQQQLQASITQINALIEPIMMLTIGTIIGSLVLAMYLPIFSMANNL